MAVGYVGFIYVIILLAGKSIWERFHVCKFLVGDAKEFYTIVASGWDSVAGAAQELQLLRHYWPPTMCDQSLPVLSSSNNTINEFNASIICLSPQHQRV